MASDALAWRVWDGELVVYNDFDGNTHHLSPLGSELLQALLRNAGGMEAPALIELAVANASEADVSAPHVERALEELARLGLVARNSV